MTQAAAYRQTFEETTEETVEVSEADEFVDTLKNAQVVYRTFSSPMSGVTDVSSNCKYCVKGFFLPSINSTYEFLSYHPFCQYVGISEEVLIQVFFFNSVNLVIKGPFVLEYTQGTGSTQIRSHG